MGYEVRPHGGSPTTGHGQIRAGLLWIKADRASRRTIPCVHAAMATVSYTNWGANVVVVACTLAAVLGAVAVHYEGLVWISQRLSTVAYARRQVVFYAILALIGLHIVEIWLFGLGYHLLLLWPETGHITGSISTDIFDHVYFAATVFTTVGFGDLSPQGPIRFMAGTEALTGFVLIGWSASFTYLEMEQLWRGRRRG